MLSLHGAGARLCDGLSRREVLRVGGLGMAGLSLPQLLQASENAAMGVLPTDKSFGRAKNIIFLYLLGGPPQHETFDPKPEAPVEVRGAFKPIQTNVPGIDFCELLPRTSRIADKLAIVRSLSTNSNEHDGSGYWVLTGYKYVGPNSRTIQPTDWPYFGSLVKMKKPSEVLPPLTTVWLPDVWRLNENVTPAGQTGGFLGSRWNPDVFVGDPARPDYKVQGLQLSDLPPLRLRQRESLLKQVERHFQSFDHGERARNYDRYQQQAFDLMTSGKAQKAFAVEQEPDAVRDRYGRHTWGQSLLLARRLVEAGVRLVHVNWPREPGDNAVDNPLWDTHTQNADRLEDVLCPKFDVSFTALIEDLEQRGLLKETLVVAIGEFGRTPKINGNGGRDHWGHVFSFAMAGAGIRSGQVYGASDSSGAYPAKDKIDPGDFTATLFHLLGIPSAGTFHDREGREQKLTLGTPIHKILGTEPATWKAQPSTGDLARVPPYDDSLILNTKFQLPLDFFAFDGPSRPKGWRADPVVTAGSSDTFGVRWVDEDSARKIAPTRHAALGFGVETGKTKLEIPQGATAILAQEVRSPFAGSFVLRAKIVGDGTSKDYFESMFQKNFTCRLLYYRYTDAKKSPRQRTEMASLVFQPKFVNAKSPELQTIEFPRVFENPTPGGNFSFGLGMGVALVIEKTSPGTLEINPGTTTAQAFVRVEEFQLEFEGKKRKENVTV